MRHITVFECYDTLEIQKDITDKSITFYEAEELEKYISTNKLERDNIVWGRNSVTFINYVGFIKLSTVQIEILPKINLNNSSNEENRKVLIRMLQKSGIIKVRYSEMASLKLYKMNLNEILAFLFAKTLQSEIAKGAYLEYIYKEDNINTLKGKLILAEHLKNKAANRSKVYCRYEELSINNSLNIIFKTCINTLNYNVRNPETIKILRYLNSLFIDVLAEGSIDKINLNYKFNRLNKRYEASFVLAKMILGGYSATGTEDKSKAFAILFKMDEVFEKYIAKIISNSFNDYITHIQDSSYKLMVNEQTNNNIFQLQPDIVLEKNNKKAIIIDTKWKRINSMYNRHGVKRDDLYQMYAYLTRYPDAEKVILLYPDNELVDCEKQYLESWYLENNLDKKIRVCTVPLFSEEKTIGKILKIIKSN